jgi:hypothetical protein
MWLSINNQTVSICFNSHYPNLWNLLTCTASTAVPHAIFPEVNPCSTKTTNYSADKRQQVKKVDSRAAAYIGNERNTFNLNNIIQNNRFNWINRGVRMEHELIPKQLMDYTPRGTRYIGRPKLRWKDQPISYKKGTNRIKGSKACCCCWCLKRKWRPLYRKVYMIFTYLYGHEC